jgi:50S ribosomal subunit-associated GTPase HflX
VVALNKIDLLPDADLRKLGRKPGAIPISALSGYGLKDLVARMAKMLEDLDEDDVDREEDDDGRGSTP